MNKLAFFLNIVTIAVATIASAQTTNFDTMNANYGIKKSVSWHTSNYGSGFGHRIINNDPGGKTLLNFQGRHNSAN